MPPPTPTAPAPVGQSGIWDLLFNDDFDGTSLDTNKWTTCYWWDNDGCTNSGNNELEWYQPDDVLVSNGTLKLRAQHRQISTADGKIYRFTSGMITTGRDAFDTSFPAKFVFRYGYAEIRAKIPSGRGYWPATWMLPDDHTSKPEIDVMEILGHETSELLFHVHWLDSDGSHDSSGSTWRGPDFSAEWHTFAVDWQPDAIIWYVDGVERWSYTDATNIPTKPMYLLANLAVGGDWPGAPDSSTSFPGYFEIDYLRVWKRGDRAYLTPLADTFVDSTYPSTNYGSSNSLYVDGSPVKTTYLKFDSTPLVGKTITLALLRIETTSSSGAGSSNTQNVRLLSSTMWSESAVTYENLVVSSNVLGIISNTVPNTAYIIPLDTSLLQPHIGSIFTLEFDSKAGDGLYFYSKEYPSSSPLLFITTLDDH